MDNTFSYEEAYNNAIQRAKELHEAGNILTKKQMEIVFPQLAESEDERIRKTLVEYFSEGDYDTIRGIRKHKILDWLEKQKYEYEVFEPIESTIEYKLGLAAGKKEQKDAFENGRQLGIMQEQARAELGWPKDENAINALRMEYEKGRADTIAEMQKEPKAIGFNNDAAIDKVLNDYACDRYNALVKENGGKMSFARMQHLVMDVYKWAKDQCQKEQKPANEPFEEWIDSWYKEHCSPQQGLIHMSEKEFKNWSRGIRNMLEQKPVDEEELSKFCEANFNAGKRVVLNNPEEYGLHKPAEWSKVDKKMLDDIIVFVSGYADKRVVNEWVSFLKSLRPQPKQEWSEKEKDKLNRIYRILPRCIDCHPRIIGDKECIELQDFLRSITKPNVQEWSEKDEEHINSLLARLEGMCKKGATFTRTRFAVSEDMDWLKSLRGRSEKPNNHWKPSEEQMNTLWDALSNLKHDGYKHVDVLESFYRDLKKLMED